MLFLKNILIFLIIFLYEIFKTHCFFNFYSAGISGKLTCSTNALNIVTAQVEITKISKCLKKFKTISKATVKLGTSFALEGHYRRFLSRCRPHFFVKITYECSKNHPSIYRSIGRSSHRRNSIQPCQKVFLMEIPSTFIFRSYNILNFYGLRTLDLAKVSGQIQPMLSGRTRCLF
uniref:Uncharacterized protein n=1 Tax=Strongyloides venezuelensis TaxID=75913 RepID=A0A0K0FX05_STRVS